MVMGLALVGAGFLVMMLGGRRADHGALVSPLWLVAAYSCHTWGELCLSPVGLSYVTKVAPVRFASLLMGVWFLANGVADKIAGWLASFTPTGTPPAHVMTGLSGVIQQHSATYGGFFSVIAIIAFAASLLMLLFVPLLGRLVSSR
jgi:POT family proton-dependent oligopeptide transporter